MSFSCYRREAGNVNDMEPVFRAQRVSDISIAWSDNRCLVATKHAEYFKQENMGRVELDGNTECISVVYD